MTAIDREAVADFHGLLRPLHGQIIGAIPFSGAAAAIGLK